MLCLSLLLLTIDGIVKAIFELLLIFFLFSLQMDQSNMSSVRKKLDEYHLKVLRELVTLPVNKHCFDCQQRGPTYVNVTIGSFVCTKCSGMLRGLTPPHRVKSISMAAFTPEEMEFIKSRGNDYCRKVWLGLHSTDQPTKDELQIKDFMISKYEKKRYYVDPSVALSISGFDVKSNGSSSRYPPPRTVSSSPVISGTITAPLTTPSNTLQLRTTKITSSPVTNHPFIPNDDKSFYASNFRSALAPQDPFNSLANMAGDSVSSSEASFANFDKNPIFSSATQGFPNISTVGQTIDKTPKSAPPTEDRYAALKDLDSLMKTQQMTSSTPKSEPLASIGEWGLNKNTSWYSSSGFDSSCTEPESTSSMPCNPFNKSAWSIPPHGQSSNGFPTSQSLNFPSTKAWIKTDSSVHSNPFVFSPGPKDAGHHSSNPFL
ncbi:uncharacterized protein drongo isoform X4 [Bemisia tabaci]|uniref:uncharacterized protein drongo isoform X4 n=1 Tax=Bemisia tabaci TaxID=7038 RepID=UPI003B282019